MATITTAASVAASAGSHRAGIRTDLLRAATDKGTDPRYAFVSHPPPAATRATASAVDRSILGIDGRSRDLRGSP